MKILRGTVAQSGYGVASEFFAPVRGWITQRTGVGTLQNGTLNIDLPAPYIIPEEALVSREEYGRFNEFLKLKRCAVRGLRCVIVRPNTHEDTPPQGHGPAHLELMSGFHLKTTLGLSPGDRVDVEVEGDDSWWSAARGPE